MPHVIGQETALKAARVIRLHFGPIEVRKVLPADSAAYIAKRRGGWPFGRPAGDAVIRRELGVLTAAVNHAIRAKRLPREDAPIITLPPAPEPKDRWLTHAELERLFAACEVAERPRGSPEGTLPRVYRFAVLAFATASRKTAIIQLQKTQIDLERGVIPLNPPGRRQTKKRRPEVPIADWLRPLLVKILEQSTGDTLLDDAGSIRTAWENAVARAGLPGVTPHTLRHTWATLAAQDGVDLWIIAGVLGDSLATVTRNYAHHCPMHHRNAVNQIGAKIGRFAVGEEKAA